jgi:hypothetical protein
MVDSRKGDGAMERDALTERVQVIEVKLDGLTESVETLKGSVDQRFDAVDQRFDAVDRRFEAVDRRFEAVDRRFDALDRRLDEMGRAADEAHLEQRQYTEFVFTRLDTKMDAGFARVDGHIGRLERKIDRIIELVTPPRE